VSTGEEPARPPARRGPRAAGDTRSDILAAARRLFAERGYGGTSLRAVAREAGVDPALVHHYFAGKPHLFTVSIGLDLPFPQVVERLTGADPQDVPTELCRIFLEVWGDPGARDRLLSLISNIVTRPEAAQVYRRFVTEQVIGPVTARLGVDQPERRAALVASQLIGVVLVRYVIALPPLAQASPEAVIADIAPTVHRYLFDPLPELDRG
jgi:AcrR family transcriptional regulator